MADLANDIAELKKQGAELKEIFGELNKPQYRLHMTGETAGYWAADEQPIKLKTAVDNRGVGRFLPREMPAGYKPREHFKSAGEFYRLLVKDRGGFGERYNAATKAIQGMNTGVGADGGHWILPEFSQTIIDRVYQNDLWQRTDGYTVTGNTLKFVANAETSRANGSRHGGLRGYWVGEGATITDTKPATRQVALSLNKLAVLVYLTDELIEDAGPALEQYVNTKAADEFNFLLGDAVLNGNGVGMPMGLANSPALLSVAKETGQLGSTIVAENIDKMWARRIVGGDYVWLTNQDTDPQLSALSQAVGTGGVVLNRTDGSIAGSPGQLLKGVPRLDTEFNATLGTQLDIVLADLGKYITISKGGITQAASMHVEFLTDQMALRFTMRVDGRPADISPVTPYKGSNTQSHYVTLDTRA